MSARYAPRRNGRPDPGEVCWGWVPYEEDASQGKDRPILVIADYYLGSFLKQPTWVEDIRPFRAVMMPLDLPAKRSDIDRFVPQGSSDIVWVERARRSYAFDMGSALRSARRHDRQRNRPK